MSIMAMHMHMQMQTPYRTSLLHEICSVWFTWLTWFTSSFINPEIYIMPCLNDSDYEFLDVKIIIIKKLAFWIIIIRLEIKIYNGTFNPLTIKKRSPYREIDSHFWKQGKELRKNTCDNRGKDIKKRRRRRRKKSENTVQLPSSWFPTIEFQLSNMLLQKFNM